MKRKMNWVEGGVLGLALLLGACGTAPKEETQAALDAAQSAITVQSEAAKYAPDQFKAAQEAIQAGKAALARGDYDAALKGAQDAANKAKELAAAAAAKKEDLTSEWNSLNESMPRQMQQVKTRLDAYTHGAKMPAGLDKDKLAEAKAQYDQLKQGMAEATAAFNQGDLPEAMSKASAWNDVLAKLMELLGVKS